MELEERRIPNNYENGVNILGMSFATPFLVQAIVLGYAGFRVAYKLLKKYTQIKSIMCVSLSCNLFFLGFYIGIKGICGETFISFLGTFYRFLADKVEAFINPRAKFEAKSVLNEPKKDDSVDKIKKIASKLSAYITRNREKKALKMLSKGLKTGENVVFNDDFAYLKAKKEQKNG